MIYVSQQLDDFTTLNVEVTPENIFAKCSDCGRETQIDLNDAVLAGVTDLFGVRWRCESCSYKHALKFPDQQWAQQVIAEHRACQ